MSFVKKTLAPFQFRLATVGKSSTDMKQMCNSKDYGRKIRQREVGTFQAGVRRILQNELTLYAHRSKTVTTGTPTATDMQPKAN
jgi:hypothetical protein